jgi:hypothetical protein
MSNKKNKKQPEPIELSENSGQLEETELLGISEQPEGIEYKHEAVSIIPKIVKGRSKFDVVKIQFNEQGQCSFPVVLTTTNNEATAITFLFQAAHEVCGIHKLRKKIKGERNG